MVSFGDLKVFFAIFYIFGQAPYYPRYNLSKISSKCLMYLPITLHVVSFAVNSVVFATRRSRKMSESSQVILHVIKLGAISIPNVIIICEILLQSPGVWLIKNKVLFLCDFMNVKLKIPFQVEKFQSDSKWNLIVYFMTFMICVITCICVPYYDTTIEIVFLIILMFKTAGMLHALFYVNLLKFIMISLNEHKSMKSITFTQMISNMDHKHSEQYSIDYLMRIRFVHLKLWEVMQVFRRQFGWRLIGICMDSTITMIYIGNATFSVYVERGEFYSGFIRKY